MKRGARNLKLFRVFGYGNGGFGREALEMKFCNLNKGAVQPLKRTKKGVKGEGNASKLSLPKYPPEDRDILKSSWTAVKGSKAESWPARWIS